MTAVTSKWSGVLTLVLMEYLWSTYGVLISTYGVLISTYGVLISTYGVLTYISGVLTLVLMEYLWSTYGVLISTYGVLTYISGVLTLHYLLCGGHAACAHGNMLKKLMNKRSFTAKEIENLKDKYPAVLRLKCRCPKKHRSGCGCMTEMFVKVARKNFSRALHDAGTDPETFKKRVLKIQEGHVLASACGILGITNLDDDAELPQGIQQASVKRKWGYVRSLAKQVVDKWSLMDITSDHSRKTS